MDKKAPRRAYKKGNAFKENKVVIGTESRIRSQKPKKNDPHVTVESSEFQLLVKLYVPAQLLITNNRVSLKQLKVYLPILVGEDYPDLNLELHLFLSSIVTTYVSSWYLSKLNTDNTDFVVQVYTALSDFVKDLARRISVVGESLHLISMINEMAGILNQHIMENRLVDGVPCYAANYVNKGSNNVVVESDLDSLKRHYLAESHVVFSEANNDHGTSSQDEDPGQMYYRAIASEILGATFGDNPETAQGCHGSEIVTNLLTIIIADMVFGKLVGLLSSPKFLLNDILTSLATKMTQDSEVLPEKGKVQKKGVFQNITSQVSNGWKMVSSMLSKDMDVAKTRPSILYSPVFDLVDSITRFSHVRSVLAHGLSLLRASLYASRGLAHKLEDFVITFISASIRTSSVLQDGFLASTVAKLRSIVFDKTTKRAEASTKELSLKELSHLIYSSFLSKTSKIPILGALVRSLAYKDQGPNQATEEIELFLRIFAADSPESSSSDMNKLLVVKLLDCIIRQVYPSLVEDVQLT